LAADVEAALRLPGASADVEAELRALGSLAERDPARAAAALKTARRLAEESNQPGPLCVVAIMAAYRASGELRLSDALAEADTAVAAARAAADAGGGRAAARLLFALQVQSYMLYMVDRSAEAIVASEEARRLATLLGADTVVADISLNLASHAEELGQWDRAVAEIETYEQLTGDVAAAVATRYPMAITLGDLEEAERLWRRFGGAFPPGDIPHAVLLMRGRHLLAAGRPEEALAHLRGVWERSQAKGERWRTRAGSVSLVRLALDAGDRELAEAVARESTAHAELDPGVHSLVGTAQLVRAMIDGDLDAALAAVEAFRLSRLPQALGEALIEVARIAQPTGQAEAALAAASEAHDLFDGLGATRTAAIARALLSELGRPRPRGQSRPRRPTSGWESLTPTEAAVVAAIAEGLSNPQIAARLYMSRYTVESHVKHIFVKLGMRSRVELAAQAVRRDLTTTP
jgi:DNA-binding CsgD family transcriptional regulator